MSIFNQVGGGSSNQYYCTFVRASATGYSITIDDVPFAPTRIDGYCYYTSSTSSAMLTSICCNGSFNQAIFVQAAGYVYNNASNTSGTYVKVSTKKNTSGKYTVTLTINNSNTTETVQFYENSPWRFWFSISSDWTGGNQ